MQSTSHPSARHGAATIYREISDFTHTAPAPALHESTSPENIRLTQTNDVYYANIMYGTLDVDELSDICVLPKWNVLRCLQRLNLTPAAKSAAVTLSDLDRIADVLGTRTLTTSSIARKLNESGEWVRYRLKANPLRFAAVVTGPAEKRQTAWRLA